MISFLKMDEKNLFINLIKMINAYFMDINK